MVLNPKLQQLDLVDLLSDRHNSLRKIIEKMWNDKSAMNISNSEWYILAKSYKKRPTISYISKNVDVSRQAIHKQVNNLAAKGLVEIKNVEYNKKEKFLQLTTLGEECYEKYEKLKAQLEYSVAENIGEERVEILKDLLKADWGIESYKNEK